MKIRALVILPACFVLVAGLTACGGSKSSDSSANNAPSSMATAAAESSAPMEAASGAPESGAAGAVPDCGAVKAVWVNTKTHVYHEPTDPMYGKTKHGKYMCPSAAKNEGDRPAGGGKSHNSMK